MRGLFCTVILALNFSLLFAQAEVDVGPTFEKIKLDRSIAYYVDEGTSLNFTEISNQTFSSNFIPSDGNVLRFGITDANIWLRISLVNNAESVRFFIILFEDPSLYRVEQYLHKADGSVEESLTGISISPGMKPVPGNQNSFQIEMAAGESIRLFYKINSRNFISLPITANSYYSYHKESIIQRTGQGLYYGGLLIIIFYSFLAYLSTRNVTFLYYFTSIIFFGLITGTFDGTTAEYFNFLVVGSGGYYDIFLSTFSNIFGLMFMLTFLEISRVAPRYFKITKIVIGLMLAILLLGFLNPSLALQLVSLSSVPFLIFVLVGGIIALREKVWKARYYVTAYSAMTIAVTIAILSLFDIIPFSLLTKYILHIGFLLSLTILSLGLGHMINKFRLESQKIEVGKEIAKKAIVEQKNRELEQLVEQRSRDIYRKEINLRSIIDNNKDDSIWLIDSKYRLIDYNEYFEQSFKAAFGVEIQRKENVFNMLPKEMTSIWKERFDKSLNGESGQYIEEYPMGGQFMTYEIRTYPIHEKNKISGVSIYAKNVSDMKRVEKELLEHNEALTKVNEELDRFVYSASHDLKAPLASVLGLINLSRQEEDMKAKEEYLNMMQRSVERLNRFIDDIENYSRNARTEVTCEEIEVENCVNGIIEDLYYLEGVDKASIIISIDGKEPLYSDKNRIIMILSNLVNNALRYSIKHNGPEKTRIEIKVAITNKKAVFSIIDNGPGISEEFHDKIFDMFYRVHESISGTGLGLYIVKESVDRLMGKVSLQSSLDKGAKFFVEIPNKLPELGSN